jgi:hypothetical protein
MFDAKKIREVSVEAQAELERKKREAEELLKLQKDQQAKDEALKERRLQEELRRKAEEEAEQLKIAKASASFLQLIKRETILSAAKGLSETKINVDFDIDGDWITAELKERRFKISWNAKAETEQISKVVQLIDDYRRAHFIQNLPSGIPELDEVFANVDNVFDFLLDEILDPDGAVFSKGKLNNAKIKWLRLTEQWRVAFELTSIYPIDEWAIDADKDESQNVKLNKILNKIYDNINLLFESNKDSATVLNVWWDFNWLQADQSGNWDAYRLVWLSSYVGQFFMNQLEQYLRECAAAAETTASMLMEPLEPNFERWGANNVFRARVNGKPIGALIISPDFTAFMLRAMKFKVDIEPVNDNKLIKISW